jgi:hypothetical protein
MNDFVVDEPACVRGHTFFDSDCGSSVYAHALFVSWNILSMFIFVSMVSCNSSDKVAAMLMVCTVYFSHFREFQLCVSAVWRFVAGVARGDPEVQAGLGQV